VEIPPRTKLPWGLVFWPKQMTIKELSKVKVLDDLK